MVCVRKCYLASANSHLPFRSAASCVARLSLAQRSPVPLIHLAAQLLTPSLGCADTACDAALAVFSLAPRGGPAELLQYAGQLPPASGAAALRALASLLQALFAAEQLDSPAGLSALRLLSSTAAATRACDSAAAAAAAPLRPLLLGLLTVAGGASCAAEAALSAAPPLLLGGAAEAAELGVRLLSAAERPQLVQAVCEALAERRFRRGLSSAPLRASALRLLRGALAQQPPPPPPPGWDWQGLGPGERGLVAPPGTGEDGKWFCVLGAAEPLTSGSPPASWRLRVDSLAGGRVAVGVASLGQFRPVGEGSATPRGCILWVRPAGRQRSWNALPQLTSLCRSATAAAPRHSRCATPTRRRPATRWATHWCWSSTRR